MRIACELRGEPSGAIHDLHKPQASLVASRTFGQPIHDPRDLRCAVATFTTRAGERLREQHLTAHRLGVWLVHGPSHDELETLHADQSLRTATDLTRDLLAAALTLTDRLHRPGTRYRKAGVTLATGLAAGRQLDLFIDDDRHHRHTSTQTTIDRLNRRHGGDCLRFAAALPATTLEWQPQHRHRSPACTTEWEELLVPEIRKF
jgi:DNA polymerase V